MVSTLQFADGQEHQQQRSTAARQASIDLQLQSHNNVVGTVEVEESLAQGADGEV